MKNANFLLMCFLLLPMACFCQPSITRTESQLRFLSSPSQNTVKYTIKNTLKDTIYIWLQKKSMTERGDNSFRRYFFSRLTVCPLSVLCFDGNVYFDEPFVPVIGANFIKRISPNETFHVYLLNCDMDSSMIHYESINNIKKIVPPKRLDEYGFNDDYIIIDSVNF